MTFLNPWLLVGVAGLSLPIIAHLINRQQIQRTDWAAMQFLDRSVRVRTRQIKLRDILLLALRCLALLLLIFAFCRPASMTTAGISMLGEDRSGVIIAIDASYSMNHSDGKMTRFERALDKAKSISSQTQIGDPISLLLLGDQPTVLLRNVAYDPQRFEAALEDQKPRDTSLNINGIPEQLEQLLDDMESQQKEIYLITDTQANDWEELSPPLVDGMNAAARTASFFLVPVAGEDDNLAVTGLDLVSGSLRNGSVARYRATIQNFGAAPATDIEVQCLVEGVQIDSKRIPIISPGSSQTISLLVPFYNSGPTRISAKIAGDSLQTDNVRHVVAVVRDKISVLCIDGSGGEVTPLVVAGMLAQAEEDRDEGYQIETIQWPTVPEKPFEAYDVVIIADVPKVTTEQYIALTNFIRQGNGLIWFGGNNVQGSEWNRLAIESGTSLLPAIIGEVVDCGDEQGVGTPLTPSLADHPISRPLQSLPEDLLGETRVLKRLQTEADAASIKVLGLAGTNAALLLEGSLGRGQVCMFTTSAHTTWNNMAITPVFPMLIQQVVTYLSGREFEQSRVVGDSLSLFYVNQPDANDAIFETPSKQTLVVPVGEYRQQYLAMLEKSEEAGFYTARVSIQSPGIPIAVNVDTKESNVECVDPQALLTKLEGTGVAILTTDAELMTGIRQARTGKSYWRFFLITAILLLVLESLFADHIKRRNQANSNAPVPPYSQGVV